MWTFSVCFSFLIGDGSQLTSPCSPDLSGMVRPCREKSEIQKSTSPTPYSFDARSLPSHSLRSRTKHCPQRGGKKQGPQEEQAESQVWDLEELHLPGRRCSWKARLVNGAGRQRAGGESSFQDAPKALSVHTPSGTQVRGRPPGGPGRIPPGVYVRQDIS